MSQIPISDHSESPRLSRSASKQPPELYHTKNMLKIVPGINFAKLISKPDGLWGTKPRQMNPGQWVVLPASS